MIKHLFALLFFVTAAQAATLESLMLEGEVPNLNGGGTVAFTNFTIDSDAGTIDRVGMLFQMPEAATITTACFRYGARTGTPVQHKISLQAPNAAAFGPDGTVLGGGSPASATFTPPADTSWDGTVQCQTLANSYAATVGQFLWIVIEPTGTPDASNKSSFTSTLNNVGTRRILPIAASQTNGAAWASLDTTGMPVMALKSASKTYGFPIETITLTSFSVDTAGADEYGNAFTFPAAACDTVTVIGMRCHIQGVPSAAKTIRYSLYNDTTTVAAIDLPSYYHGNNGSSYRALDVLFDDTPTELTCGTQYIIAIAPQSTSSGLGIIDYGYDAAADQSAHMLGTNMFMAKRVDSGAWDLSQTAHRVSCNPILGSITEPSGATIYFPRGTGGNLQ